MPKLRSAVRRCGRINSKSSADSEAKNPFGERGAESKALSCLTGKAGLWAPGTCDVQSQDDPCAYAWQEKMASGRRLAVPLSPLSERQSAFGQTPRRLGGSARYLS